MTQPQASKDQQLHRQQEWLAGTRRVYADEVDYGKGRAQADAGRGSRAASDDKASGPRWRSASQSRAMA